MHRPCSEQPLEPGHPFRERVFDLVFCYHVLESTGRLPDRELIDRLSSCDLCVNPNPYNSFNDASVMNKILEYMALGRPVVQFDLVEGRRSAGDAAAYAHRNDACDLAKTIIELLDDADCRRVMGAEGYRRRMRDELEWRHQAPKLLAAYEAALGARRGPRRPATGSDGAISSRAG